jgi:hypothetical protein
MKRPHTITLPDHIWEYLSKYGNVSEKIRQLVEDKMDNFGTIEYHGKAYRLKEHATLSNRVFAGWFGDAAEGKHYTAEYQALAADGNGNSHLVIWHFYAIRGQEPEDEGEYNWGDVYDVRPQ